jgi:hypothetical protein
MSKRTAHFSRARLREYEDPKSRVSIMRDGDRDQFAKVRAMTGIEKPKAEKPKAEKPKAGAVASGV